MKFLFYFFKGVIDLEKVFLYYILFNVKDFVDVNIFMLVKVRVVELLEENWIIYLKEDLKIFLE